MNSMLPALMQRAPLKNGVAELSPDDSGTAVSGAEQAYLPDFGTSANVVVLLVIAQVVALLLALVRDYPAGGYLQGLGEISILILWLAVSSAWLLAAARPFLISGSALRSSILVLAIVLINTAISSQVIFWFGSTYGDPQLSGPASMFPQNRELFLARNMAIALVVTLAVLRYFYVIHQWRSNMESVAESRFVALQARIRPHFLFNSMNTIASLTRSDPLAAERAIEDLADLFRASLGNSDEPISLEQELEVARVYQRMEEQRLGDRLTVDWQLDNLPMQTPVPGLTIQPLLENAIYHGIEPLASGGVVTITGKAHDGVVSISVSNPLAPQNQRRKSNGHQLALDNIRQRLALTYGDRARLDVEERANHFSVLIEFPQIA
jgi:two-component system sensor histidine kinase AlgZ